MAVDPLVKVQLALRNQVSRNLHTVCDSQHAFTAFLLALDTMYDTKGLRVVRDKDMQGPEIQFDYETGLPVVAGVQHQAAALSAFVIAAAENHAIRGARMGYSAYQGAETIRKSTLNRMKRSPQSAVPYIKKVAKAMSRAVVKDLDEDLFPSTNMVDNATTYHWGEDHVMAIAYPLQDPASGTYEYANLNLNASGYTGIKAVVAGNGTTGFGLPTPSNLRKKLIFPLRHTREAKPDIGLCDSDVLDYMITNAEQSVLIDMSDKLNFGATVIKCVGLMWMPVDRLNVLANTASQKRELYVLESEHHRWMSWGVGDDVKVIDDLPREPGNVSLQTYYECAYVNELPRNDARAYDVVLS